MNLEKLGLLLFLKATQEHQKIAGNFKNALTQLVLAGLNSAKLVQTATIESEVLKPYGSAQKTLKQFDVLNSELIEWLGQTAKTGDASKKEVLRQIVTEILAGLADEKQALENSKNPLEGPQIQALTAIADVLKNRFLTDAQPAEQGPDASKRNAS